MSGYAIAISPCFGCGTLFGYNPSRVPSIRVDRHGKPVEQGGRREPICEACVRLANPKRRANGLPEIVIYPDSYEPIPESELQG